MFNFFDDKDYWHKYYNCGLDYSDNEHQNGVSCHWLHYLLLVFGMLFLEKSIAPSYNICGRGCANVYRQNTIQTVNISFSVQ